MGDAVYRLRRLYHNADGRITGNQVIELTKLNHSVNH